MTIIDYEEKYNCTEEQSKDIRKVVKHALLQDIILWEKNTEEVRRLQVLAIKLGATLYEVYDTRE